MICTECGEAESVTEDSPGCHLCGPCLLWLVDINIETPDLEEILGHEPHVNIPF